MVRALNQSTAADADDAVEGPSAVALPDILHPATREWFSGQFTAPTVPQVEGWRSIAAGQDTLIAAPTGSGKTLAAFLAGLDQLYRQALSGEVEAATQILYISPLKALSNDIQCNLQAPLLGLRQHFSATAADGQALPGVTSAVRTGDTTASERQRIGRQPPHILVTTPESFYLLLTSVSGRKVLSTVRQVIVDEIHAVAGNRRGAHLALSLERLDELVLSRAPRAGEGGAPRSRPQRIGLSATQKPIAEIGRYLTGGDECTIIDAGHKRHIDVALELPASPLEAVMAGEVWSEVYDRLAQLVDGHTTTLVFVNTRRMAERVNQALKERLGEDCVTSHHGSLSTKMRHRAEQLLKNGQLKALVATASLEMGIDIGAVDLVCQLGATRSIAGFLQRVGRSGHTLMATPKGRLFPLSRDELWDCVALLQCVAAGDLDRVHIPQAPIDVLAQQLVAEVASSVSEDGKHGEEDYRSTDALFEQFTRAWPYRRLQRRDFDAAVDMLAQGYAARRGRRGAYLHLDAVNEALRPRRGARLAALMNGGAIPETADYRVELLPEGNIIGTLHEDFAIESMPGDIFQLGASSWQITAVRGGVVQVVDAHGQPPSIPFWLGEAPARTTELSAAVHRLRLSLDRVFEDQGPAAAGLAQALDWLNAVPGVCSSAARQLAEYAQAIKGILGVVPNQHDIVLERFFDEAGGMQLVLHSAFGVRLNRAWGLALRKRFCRSFNFELQAAATEDAIVLSLGETHSFPLADVFAFLQPATVRGVLVQALLDAPMFETRWRWNANRALAVLRRRSGKKVPAPIQRMEADDLIAVVFPDQLACLENIQGDREIPDHPLVQQTIRDCLIEAMDIDAFERVLERLAEARAGVIDPAGQAMRCHAVDLPEPSPLAHEILSAKPYAFLDNAPLEERRTQAVILRRTLPSAAELAADGEALGLDARAIDRVREEAAPPPRDAEEAHDRLLAWGVVVEGNIAPDLLERLGAAGRAASFALPGGDRRAWVAAETSDLARGVYGGAGCAFDVEIRVPRRLRGGGPDDEGGQVPGPEAALVELLRGLVSGLGPVVTSALAAELGLAEGPVDHAFLQLEAQGVVLRGYFDRRLGPASVRQWCDRRILARIHRLTLSGLRKAIAAVSPADFQAFLFEWQHVQPSHRLTGPGGLEEVLTQLDGFSAAAGAWETHILPQRITDYSPQLLDTLCLSGEFGFARLSGKNEAQHKAHGTLSAQTPIAFFARHNLPHWLLLARSGSAPLSGAAKRLRAALASNGALFPDELGRLAGVLESELWKGLGELFAAGVITADSPAALRYLLHGRRKIDKGPRRRSRPGRSLRPLRGGSLSRGGRFALLPRPEMQGMDEDPSTPAGASRLTIDWFNDATAIEAVEAWAYSLVFRYGVVFRALHRHEAPLVPWWVLRRALCRLEDRGEVRGGRFVRGFSGEQFAHPEAVSWLRKVRSARQRLNPETPPEAPGERDDAAGEALAIGISAADPLNLTGTLVEGPRVAARSGGVVRAEELLPSA